MEPHIQYAKTSDGVSIAYASAGEGPPLIQAPSPPLSHVQLQWRMFGYVMQPVTQMFRLTWYDSRGSGLSDRRAIDFSMDAMCRDLEAVADRASPEKFALLAIYDAVPIAVTYAAANPSRLSHLILVDGWAKFTEDYDKATIQADEALRDGDWTLYTETLARVLIGFEDPVFAARYAEYIRACVDADACREAFSEHGNEGYDVTGVLDSVTTPTLVIHNAKNAWVSPRAAQRLAAGISDARLVVIDDIALQSLPALIAEATGQTAMEEEPKPSATASGTAVILFADIVDSTAFTERLGDAAFREMARDLDGDLRSLIREYSGTPIEGKLLGDGVLAVFTSARQAIEAALACAIAGTEGGLPLHLGLHAGDVIREDNNVYGGAVNIASRISGLSAPGEVLVSDTVRSLARTSAGVRFEDRGEQALKGVSEPVRVWAVREKE
jgi:class 3 adenylate cyclase